MDFVCFMLGIMAAAVLALLYVVFVFYGSKRARNKIKDPEKIPDDRPELPCPDTFDSICSAFFGLIADVEQKEETKTKGNISVNVGTKKSGLISAECLYAVDGKPVSQIARDELRYKNLRSGQSLITDGKGWYETSSKHENICYKCDKVEGFAEYLESMQNDAEKIENNVRKTFRRLLPDYDIEKCELNVDTESNTVGFVFEAR